MLDTYDLAESIERLRIKIFADGSDPSTMLSLAKHPLVKGFVTNPTLMRKAGISDYEQFARTLTASLPPVPISFAVFADDRTEMLRQARKIASWGKNVFVKVPVTDTKGESTAPVVRELTADGVGVNVTALMTADQVERVCAAISDGVPAFISVFAGRIADTGRDPLPIVRDALDCIASRRDVELIWASPREVLNIFQADAIGTHAIAATADLLAKLDVIGKDLTEYSLDTVRMFARDAANAGFEL